VGDDDQTARETTSSTNTSNRPAHDQGDGRWGRATYNRTQLEYDDGGEIDPFDRKKSEKFAKEKLKGAKGK
jgi:hypothetical protein